MSIYSGLSRKVFIPLYDLVSGRDVSRYINQLEKTQWLTKKELERYQLKKLKKLIAHSYKNVAFYKKRLDEAGLKPRDIKSLKDLKKMPILKKQDIIRYPNDLISRTCKKNELIFTPTGGSTGEPLKLYQHKKLYDLKKAMILRGNSYGGLEINERHILLWGGPNEITFANTFKGKIRHGIMNRKLLDTFFLQPKNMKRYVKTINDFKPIAITGYANSLYTFSKFIKDNDLKVFSPRTIFSTAEMLLDFQREMIEEVFRCKVLNWYGCREVGEIAQQCSKGNMHINADCLVVEFLKDNKPVKPGQTGSVVITDLNNICMPLIRYEIGDLGVPSKKVKCSCGRSFPIMEVSKGRVSDMFLMPDGRVIHGEYFTHLFYDLEGLKQFQMIQKKKDLIIVKVVKGPGLSEEEVKSTIKNLMKGKIDERVRLKFEFPNNINPEKSGKYCFTRSEVKLDF